MIHDPHPPAGQTSSASPRRPGATRVLARAVVDSRAARVGVAAVGRLLPAPRVHLTRYDVPAPRLPRHLDGLRVLHVSDLHVHPGSDLAWQVPDLVASVDHDLLCYTGDFIDVDADIPAVARLLSRMPAGRPAFAVLGNHDYIPFGRTHGANDVARLRAVLAEAGVAVLSNECRLLHDGAVVIAGADDPATWRDDVARALAQAPPAACTLLLAHSPDVVLRLAGHRPDLVLAGHTHGGQIRLPRIGALLTLSALPRHLAMGLGTYAGVPVFVSRGVGYSGLRLRLGSPAEVALLTLRAGAS